MTKKINVYIYIYSLNVDINGQFKNCFNVFEGLFGLIIIT